MLPLLVFAPTKAGAGGRMKLDGAKDERNSNRNKVRIEIGVSHSKQTIDTASNRNNFRVSSAQLRF
jgi:hypothetical protein